MRIISWQEAKHIQKLLAKNSNALEARKEKALLSSFWKYNTPDHTGSAITKQFIYNNHFIITQINTQ